MWSEQPIEKELKKRLKSKFGREEGDKFYASYVEARNYVIDNVLGEIPGAEPNLTKHDATHVKDVLQRTFDLLKNNDDLSAIELYILCLICCFHDVGNVKGRTGHNEKVGEIYSLARGRKPQYNPERQAIISASKAHCGLSVDGTPDTLKDVPQTFSIYGEIIRLRDLAAIFRLADELCEGPHRTSHYKNNTREGGYSEESQPYHNYANITNIGVDSTRGIIMVAYFIDINPGNLDDVATLLSMTYERIIKLDQERKYCKYYTAILSNFKKTEITINFYHNDNPVGPVLETFILVDECPLPLDGAPNTDKLLETYPQLDISTLIAALDQECKKNVSYE